MSTNSSWVPNEPSQALFTERCWLQGSLLCALAYGINVCLYSMAVYQLVWASDRKESKKTFPLLIYITIVFIFDTIFTVSIFGFTQMAFIDDRNYPGGPSAFENEQFAMPLGAAGSVAFVFVNWLCNAFMVWRFKVIYQTGRFLTWILMLFPSLMFVCSIVLGILFLVQGLATNPYGISGINFMLPYLSVSLVYNMLLTVLIVGRLLTYRRRIASLLGSSYGKQYTSVAAMIVESVAIYSIYSLPSLVLFGINNAVSLALLQVLSHVQSIAVLLIVFRIARGNGWTAETANQIMVAEGASDETGLVSQHHPTKDVEAATSSEELRGEQHVVKGVFTKENV